MTDSRIATVFADARSSGRMAFMPFITAGDPDLDMTAELIRTLGGEHVDLIEVGFPYSDPIADGPVVQASYTRALKNKIRVADIFKTIHGLKNENVPPLVAMVAYSIIYRCGIEKFLRGAAEAGFAGLIVPDLPGDEAGEFAHIVRGYDLDLVQLVAPTTPAERVEKIIRSASGFLYCISVAGVTGTRDTLPPALVHQLDDLRRKTDLPLAVGFGVSRPEQVDMLSGHADGVIVGSAIVRKLEPLADGTADRQAVLREIDQFAAAMVAAVAYGNAPET